MHKILITGSSGRIGRALHWQLCQDYDVAGIDVAPSSATSRIVDIRNYEQLLRSFEGADTIFHSAALYAPHVGIASEKEFYDINVHATEKICRAAYPAIFQLVRKGKPFLLTVSHNKIKLALCFDIL
jgi:UDP-glucose 4-epimerase